MDDNYNWQRKVFFEWMNGIKSLYTNSANGKRVV